MWVLSHSLWSTLVRFSCAYCRLNCDVLGKFVWYIEKEGKTWSNNNHCLCSRYCKVHITATFLFIGVSRKKTVRQELTWIFRKGQEFGLWKVIIKPLINFCFKKSCYVIPHLLLWFGLCLLIVLGHCYWIQQPADICQNLAEGWIIYTSIRHML